MTPDPNPSIPWARIVADVADALIFIDTQGVIRGADLEPLFRWNPAAG